LLLTGASIVGMLLALAVIVSPPWKSATKLDGLWEQTPRDLADESLRLR
jgi:hypothetical protein